MTDNRQIPVPHGRQFKRLINLIGLIRVHEWPASYMGCVIFADENSERKLRTES